jgi:hypothetical protein
MNAFNLTLISLIGALLAQSIVAVLALALYLRKDLPGPVCRTWLAMAIGALLLALHHGYTLELALRTGLYDFRQALLAGLVGLFFALGVYGLKRQQA